MLPQPVVEKLNEQITNELGASQAYLALSCHFAEKGLSRLSAFFRRQSDEERDHALKFVDHLVSLGAAVRFGALSAPRHEFADVPAAIQTALDSEKKVTGQIHALVELAEQHRDHATRVFLQWFVTEQIEEVAIMEQLLLTAKLANGQWLLLESNLPQVENE